MTSTWLRRDVAATKANTSQLRGLLSNLESVFGGTAEARRNIDKTLGTEDSPPRRAALANLKDASNQQIAALRQQIRQQFATVKQQAAQNRAAATRDFHAGADGAAYLQSLTAFAALAGHLDANGLADRINQALDTGLKAHARAWSEVARLNPPTNPDGALYLALDRAAAEALSPAELAATIDAEYLDNAERRFDLFTRNLTDSRLAFALDRGDDTHAAGFFDAPNIMGDAPVEAGTSAGEGQ